jgi:hypothetical protein
MRAYQEAMMKGCLEKMKATNLEANTEEIRSKLEHQEVLIEEAKVETVGVL